MAEPLGFVRSFVGRGPRRVGLLKAHLKKRARDGYAQNLLNAIGKEIAERLFISPDTVRKHTADIHHKLNVHRRREAVSAARMMGLLPS